MTTLRPPHYGGENNPFEPIKIIHHYNLNFNLGNIIKYVLRPEKGKVVEDLIKAKTYIEFELARLGQEAQVVEAPAAPFFWRYDDHLATLFYHGVETNSVIVRCSDGLYEVRNYESAIRYTLLLGGSTLIVATKYLRGWLGASRIPVPEFEAPNKFTWVGGPMAWRLHCDGRPQPFELAKEGDGFVAFQDARRLFGADDAATAVGHIARKFYTKSANIPLPEGM